MDYLLLVPRSFALALLLITYYVLRITYYVLLITDYLSLDLLLSCSLALMLFCSCAFVIS